MSAATATGSFATAAEPRVILEVMAAASAPPTKARRVVMGLSLLAYWK
jgi:hypothetical protein